MVYNYCINSERNQRGKGMAEESGKYMYRELFSPYYNRYYDATATGLRMGREILEYQRTINHLVDLGLQSLDADKVEAAKSYRAMVKECEACQEKLTEAITHLKNICFEEER
jgi:hypothetical protein